jgi:hypothetical protein
VTLNGSRNEWKFAGEECRALRDWRAELRRIKRR